MKKLLSCVAVAFMLVACGSDTPDVVAKNFTKAMNEGEIEKAFKYVYFKSEDEKQKNLKGLMENIDEIKQSIKEANAKTGGIKSIEASILNQIDNLAKVKITATSKNGEVNSREQSLIKVNDTWYIEYGK